MCVCVGGREGVGVSLCMLSYCCYGRIKQQCGSCAQGNNRLYIFIHTRFEGVFFRQRTASLLNGKLLVM